MLIATHKNSFVWRDTTPVGQFAITIPLASYVAKNIAGSRHICCYSVMWRWGGFWALHKGNVNGGIRRGRRTAVQHGGIMKRASIFFIEVLQPRGIWRKEKLSEGICQSRSRLNLAELCRSGRQMVLAQHRPLRGLAFWDAAKTWKQQKNNKKLNCWLM